MSRILTIAQIVWLEMWRRKDVYVLLILMAAFLAALVSMNLFGVGGVVGYVKEVGLLLVWIFGWILAVNSSARHLPQEELRGTIYPLLAKPIRRGELILGKWLGTWSMAVAATLLFYAVLWLVVLWRGSTFGWILMGQALVLHLFLLGILAAVGILFSTRMNYDAAVSLTYVTTLAAFLFLPAIPHLLTQEQGWRQTMMMALFYALPHLEFFDIRTRLVHGWEPVPGLTLLQILAYGLAVMGVLLALSWLAYRRKRFSRGAQL